MADTIVNTRPTNGVSYSYRHEITATDVTNGAIIFDFQNSKNLVATVELLDAMGTILVSAGMIKTYPEVGQVRVEDGTLTWVAGQIIEIVCNLKRP
jgi:hypothetical protein